ncbi:MAG: hypothetical protein AB1589_40515 [Cyanobacteriota bacterium]
MAHNLKRENDTAYSHSLPGMEERSLPPGDSTPALKAHILDK